MAVRLPDISSDMRIGVPPVGDGHIDMTSLRENTLYHGKKPSLVVYHPEYPFALSNKDKTNTQMYQSNVDWLVIGNVRTAYLNGFTQEFVRAGEARAIQARGTDFYMPANFREVFDIHDAYYRYLLDKRSDVLALVTDQTEYSFAKQAGKIAVIRANEGCEGADLDDIAYMRSRGVTSFGLKWNDYKPGRLEMGAPSRLSGTHADEGLTDWGKQAVREITSNGGTVDISHASDKTALGMIELSIDRPAIATHSFFRTEDPSTEHMGTPSKRNLSQYIIDALWANGGSMGIPGSKTFIRDWPTVMNFLKYMGDAGRLSMVKIGSDSDGMAPGSHVPGFDNSATLSTIFAFQMRQAGFNNREIFGVLYGHMDRDLQKNLPKAA